MLFFDYAHELGAEFTMKTDDDSYVFPDRILMELRKMPQECVYWGQANRLPDGRRYKNSVLSVPLHKWYIPRKPYMCVLLHRAPPLPPPPPPPLSLPPKKPQAIPDFLSGYYDTCKAVAWHQS